MSAKQARRVTRELTEADKNRLQTERQQVAAELPDLIDRDRMRNEARNEPTLSGELRRAVHASELSLTAIASRAGITPLMLDEFLTGERTLRSDVLDRLAQVLGYLLQRTA